MQMPTTYDIYMLYYVKWQNIYNTTLSNSILYYCQYVRILAIKLVEGVCINMLTY